MKKKGAKSKAELVEELKVPPPPQDEDLAAFLLRASVYLASPAACSKLPETAQALASAGLRILAQGAREGDAKSARALVDTLTSHAVWLNLHAEKEPSLYRTFLAYGDYWPVPLNGTRSLAAISDALLVRLGIGRIARHPSADNPDLKAADRLLAYIHAMQQVEDLKPEFRGTPLEAAWIQAKKLQEFTRTNIERWWKVGLALFEHCFGTNFEELPDFAHHHGKRYEGLTDKQKQTRRRSDIKRAVKQALGSLSAPCGK